MKIYLGYPINRCISESVSDFLIFVPKNSDLKKSLHFEFVPIFLIFAPKNQGLLKKGRRIWLKTNRD